MMINNRQSIKRFWILWLIASSVGTAAGIAIIFWGIAPLINKLPQIGSILFDSIIGVVLGAFAGTAQWFILRKYIVRVTWWPVITSFGWVLFWVLESSSILSKLLGERGGIAFVADALHFTFLGFLVGVLQWLLLRKKVFAADWWILASVVGTTFGAVVADSIALALGGDSPLDFLTGSIIWTLITGICMMWLMRHTYDVTDHEGKSRSHHRMNDPVNSA
jgi:hypothetical protein